MHYAYDAATKGGDIRLPPLWLRHCMYVDEGLVIVNLSFTSCSSKLNLFQELEENNQNDDKVDDEESPIEDDEPYTVCDSFPSCSYDVFAHGLC